MREKFDRPKLQHANRDTACHSRPQPHDTALNNLAYNG
jgi:hypothetical protein